jgi:hypothetical protein
MRSGRGFRISEVQLGINLLASVNPQSAIRNLQSAICNPQSAIRNPQSAIRNPQSAIIRESAF